MSTENKVRCLGCGQHIHLNKTGYGICCRMEVCRRCGRKFKGTKPKKYYCGECKPRTKAQRSVADDTIYL